MFGAALLGPVGAVLQGVKGAVAGGALGAATGVAARTTINAAKQAVTDVPHGWQSGKDLGYRAASATVAGMVNGVEWLADHSGTFHNVFLWLQKKFQEEPTGADWQRVHQVDGGIWRSAQPGPDVWKDLAARGFKSVVNLREEKNYEADAVKAAGLEPYYLPEAPLQAPTVQQALDFLHFVTDPAHQPVLFHCYSGVDRTGTMAACYRIAVQGWSQDQALAEALELGMVKELQADKIRFIKEFNTAWQEMKAKGTAPSFAPAATP